MQFSTQIMPQRKELDFDQTIIFFSHFKPSIYKQCSGFEIANVRLLHNFIRAHLNQAVYFQHIFCDAIIIRYQFIYIIRFLFQLKIAIDFSFSFL